MNLKALVLVIGVLVICQLALFGWMFSGNVETLNASIGELEGQVRSASAEKADLTKTISDLRKVIASIPPGLLAGFEDPEAGFVEFLDYLQSPVMQDAGATASLRGQTYTTTPIPLHVTEFTFKYSFADTYSAERFADFVIFQERFPLQVRQFSAKRTGSGLVEGEMGVALMIPAKLQLSAPAASK